MSGNVVAWVFRRFPVKNELDRNRKLVLSEVAEAANRDFECSHPGVATICASWGFGRSTVLAHLRWLVDNGWLEITEPGRGRGHATVYRVCQEKVREPDVSSSPKGPSGSAEKVQMEPSAPYTSSVRDTPASTRRRDELFEKVCEVCDLDLATLTASERGRVNRACAELRQLQPPPTAQDVEAFARNWRRQSRFGITPQTITGNWQRIMRTGDRQAARERQRLADMGVTP